MRTIQRITAITCFAALLTLFGACEKTELNQEAQPQKISVSELRRLTSLLHAGAVFQEVQPVTAFAGKVSTWNATIQNSCATITFDTLSNPARITINYGKEPCLSTDGHTYSGQLVLTYSQDFFAEGSIMSYTAEDFTVDGEMYQGSKTMTCLGVRTSAWGEYLEYSVVEDIQVTDLETQERSSVTSEYNYTLLDGSSTQAIEDDIYQGAGAVRLELANGTVYQMETSESLIVFGDFPSPVSGILKLVTNNEPVFRIDYGYPSGERDNLALVLYPSGETEVIQL